MRIKAHIKLRPCKYCGEAAEILPHEDNFIVFCSESFFPCCFMNRIMCPTEHEARVAWNKEQEENE